MATFTSNGTPITEPSPQYDIPLVCNNGALKARHQSGLPLGYTLLDYIESTGTQYIDTVVQDTSKLEINNLNFTSFGSVYDLVYGSQFGSGTSAKRRQITIPTTKRIMVVCGTGTNQSIVSPGETILADNVDYNIIAEFSTVSKLNLNGTEYVSSDTGDNAQTGLNDYLFCYNINGTANYIIKAKMGRVKIWGANSSLVRDFVPVKNASNVVGMYDLVSGQFFTNAGTGDFVAGSTVSDPVEVYTTGPIETIAIKDDQSATVSTATCEDLLSVGTYTDEQEVIAGNVTRKCGVLILDGTETWTKASGYTNIFYTNAATDAYYNDSSAERIPLTCTHLTGTDATNTNMQDNTIKLTAQGAALSTPLIYIKASVSSDNLTTWQNWLAAQYAAGTPVIVVYPLATSTTETVTGQDMEIVDGDNTVEITQASMDGLELEVTYMAAVSLTIQEVQDANLDPNVQVTIN